jgi:NAD(P)-dependent dehydrogenase (short-subunit alcohol dehydrogenase family)
MVKMGTVLVVGSTGNIGVSVIIASLRLDLHVIAVVRNAASAEKILKHTGVNEAITIVEADVTSEEGVQGVVDRVKEGKLPAFNHVYSAGM